MATLWDATPVDLARAILGKGSCDRMAYQDTDMSALVDLEQWEGTQVLPKTLPAGFALVGPRQEKPRAIQKEAHPGLSWRRETAYMLRSSALMDSRGPSSI